MTGGCLSTDKDSLANAVLGDMLPHGAWSFDWGSTFNPFQNFLVSTKSGVQKELHIHASHDKAGALVFTLSSQQHKGFDLRKYDGVEIVYNLFPNENLATACAQEGSEKQFDKLLRTLTDADLVTCAEDRTKLGVQITDRRGRFVAAKGQDVTHGCHIVPVDDWKYQPMPSHQNISVLFPLRSDSEDVKIAFQPSDARLVVYNITFFSTGKFVDFSPIECPMDDAVFDATPALMASLEPLGAWRYESDANTSEAGGFRDQVFKCHDTSVGVGIVRSSLSFSGWRNIKGRMILDVAAFGKSYNRLELGYQNTYVAKNRPADYSYCRLSVIVHDTEGREFKVLDQQPSQPDSGNQVLFLDLHSKSKEIHFMEEGDCVFYIDYIRVREVGTLVLFSNTTSKGAIIKTIGPDPVSASVHKAGADQRIRNFFRVSVEPPQCDHSVTLCKGVGCSVACPGVARGECLSFDLNKDTGAVAGTIPWSAQDTLEVKFEDKQIYDFKCDITLITEAFPITLDGVDAYDACLGLVHHSKLEDDVNHALSGLEPKNSWSSDASSMIFDCNRRGKDSFELRFDATEPALRLNLLSTDSSKSLRGIKMVAESLTCQVAGKLTTTSGDSCPDCCKMRYVNGTTDDHLASEVYCNLHSMNGLAHDKNSYALFDLYTIDPTGECTVGVRSIELDYGYPVKKIEISDVVITGYADFTDYVLHGSASNTNLRSNGLQYSGVEVLSVHLSNHDNTLNVHGTSSKTQVTFQDGNDYVTMSSAASVIETADVIGYKTSLPDGTLEYVYGTRTLVPWIPISFLNRVGAVFTFACGIFPPG